MTEKYEQLELDTRDQLQREIDLLTQDWIRDIRDMTVTCREGPEPIRNRHEAYGHAAEQLGKVMGSVKRINKDTNELLNTLADPNLPAIDAVSSIANSTRKAAVTIMTAAAEMDRIRDELYSAENLGKAAPAPMDEYIESAMFQEAEEAPEDDSEE